MTNFEARCENAKKERLEERRRQRIAERKRSFIEEKAEAARKIQEEKLRLGLCHMINHGHTDVTARSYIRTTHLFPKLWYLGLSVTSFHAAFVHSQRDLYYNSDSNSNPSMT